MVYKFKEDFFLITNLDTGEQYLYSIYLNAFNFMYDKMKENSPNLVCFKGKFVPFEEINWYDAFCLELNDTNLFFDDYFIVEKIQIEDWKGEFIK